MTIERSNETPKRELLVFYYKYRARLVLSFLLPFAAAVFVSTIPTPRYTAESTLVVRLGSEYVYQPETGAGAGTPSPIPFDRDQIYKAEVAILGSQDIHRKVVETVGLDRMFPSHPGKESSSVSFRKKLVAQLDAWYPDDADDSFWGRAANSLRVSLIGEDLDMIASPVEQDRKRFEKGVEAFEKRLGVSLGKDSAVISVTYENANRQVAVEAVDTLIKLYLEKRKGLYQESRSAVAKAQVDSMRRRVAGAQAAVEAFKREQKIYSLPDQRAQLLTQRDDVRKQMMVVSNPALEDKLRMVTTQLDSLDAQERKFNALENELQIANQEYSLFVQKFDEAQAYDSMERARAGSVRVIQPPAASVEPRRLQGIIIAAGFFLSLVFAAFVAVVTEFSRSGFLTPERLERNLGMPVLAAFPRRK